ncbi:hypothetical protein HH308_25165 [Gordonia sp. TBRC 11910]|uniref:Thymidylate synthase n=1 Tax=Gordonia asplenii TaxID=2725283 RepID=A0A848L0V8_9ACTN|nr:hypothetical protein [Gordonia asplenii]NMO04514.1 hypothetical protein [Gordonia asplenii]
MSEHVHGSNIGDAWVNAFELLAGTTANEVVNLTVTIANPGLELSGVRRQIDRAVAQLRLEGRDGFIRNAKSVHTVANTIFPISLYRVGRADSFYNAVRKGQSGRKGTVTSWGPNSGTYAGRLVRYPTYDKGEFNQIKRLVEYLNNKPTYRDRYELSLTCEPPEDEPANRSPGASASTFVPGYDNATRGGQCLSHISLNVTDGTLSMTALYRHQTFVGRAYGNFLGLARLQHFLVHETDTDLRPGELMVVASHADIESAAASQRVSLLESSRACLAEQPVPIEWQARQLGSSWSDLELPALTGNP